ncbi:MAG: hypothetical protein UMU04_07025 [Halanaerobiales bacterium]|nr:hypothetical protein [Halanaerobiales bacterium]
MSEKEILTFIAKIEDDLNELDKLVSRIEKGWEKYNISHDDFYSDSTALNLHGFYSGLEKIFIKIAEEIDESAPDGSSWHKELLDQMALNIRKIRPAVISKETRDILDEYRAFRHIVRNVYAFNYSPDKIKILIKNFNSEYQKIKNEVIEFLDFLESQS